MLCPCIKPWLRHKSLGIIPFLRAGPSRPSRIQDPCWGTLKSSCSRIFDDSWPPKDFLPWPPKDFLPWPWWSLGMGPIQVSHEWDGGLQFRSLPMKCVDLSPCLHQRWSQPQPPRNSKAQFIRLILQQECSPLRCQMRSWRPTGKGCIAGYGAFGKSRPAHVSRMGWWLNQVQAIYLSVWLYKPRWLMDVRHGFWVCWRLSPSRWVTSNKVLVLVMTHVSARNFFLADRKGNCICSVTVLAAGDTRGWHGLTLTLWFYCLPNCLEKGMLYRWLWLAPCSLDELIQNWSLKIGLWPGKKPSFGVPGCCGRWLAYHHLARSEFSPLKTSHWGPEV